MPCMEEWVLTLATNLCNKLFEKIIQSCRLVVVLTPNNCIFLNYFLLYNFMNRLMVLF